MVEASNPAPAEETQSYEKGFRVPDETNLHRTISISAPYGRYRTRMLRKDQGGQKAIGPSDTDLGEEKEVVMPLARPEESVKRIASKMPLLPKLSCNTLFKGMLYLLKNTSLNISKEGPSLSSDENKRKYLPFSVSIFKFVLKYILSKR